MAEQEFTIRFNHGRMVAVFDNKDAMDKWIKNSDLYQPFMYTIHGLEKVQSLEKYKENLGNTENVEGSKKLLAIEKLQSELLDVGIYFDYEELELFEQAKAIEKEKDTRIKELETFLQEEILDNIYHYHSPLWHRATELLKNKAE